RHLRFSHPGKRPPGCKAQRRFAPARFVVAAGSCSFLAWFFHPFESRSPQGRKRAPAMADVQGAVYRVSFTLDG
ncbi:hypothetical protein, partial [Klebsiella pneumoniae]|uniref:hypothetical protein n=1 Tax=Klebsiella pneumoniae TaxID=573 RepID=UPI0035B30496